MKYEVKFINDIDIFPKITISKIDEINKRMKLILGKEIKQIKNNKSRKYTIPKEVFIGKQIYDEVRYYLKVNSNGEIVESKYIGKLIKDETLLKEYECYEKVLIIGESPHRNEFTFNYKPIGPAQAKTGYAIEDKIGNIIEKFGIKSKELIVVISNPVQFQASLGTFYSSGLCDEIRTNLWSALYNKDDYLNRLKDIDAKYVVNATTYGRKDRIKQVVHEYEKMRAQKPMVKVSDHPSCWIGKKIDWES